jgi:hypothetical protein
MIRAALAAAALCALVGPASARANTVTDWNEWASTAIVATAKQPPPVSVLSFAMVQGAVYHAVRATHRRDSQDAAAATAPTASS